MTVRTPNLSLFTDAGVEADVAAMQRTAARIRRTAETRLGNAGVLDTEARERGRFGIRIAGSPDDFDARASFEKVVIDLATGGSRVRRHVQLGGARRSAAGYIPRRRRKRQA